MSWVPGGTVFAHSMVVEPSLRMPPAWEMEKLIDGKRII